jgi:hypothetical protein
MNRLAPLAMLCFGAAVYAETFPLPCTYAGTDPRGELRTHAECAAFRGDRLFISQERLASLFFATDGLAQVLIDGTWYYVKPNGDLLSVLAFDNGADSYSEGLVRSMVDGKIAYFDTAFDRVIEDRYDWGWPFEGGRALVCIGCLPGPADADGHRAMEGGVWGYIDRRGKEIVPVTRSRDEARSP